MAVPDSPPIHQIANKYLVKIHLVSDGSVIVNMIVARDQGKAGSNLSLWLPWWLPLAMKEGNIPQIFDPKCSRRWAPGQELIFVEGVIDRRHMGRYRARNGAPAEHECRRALQRQPGEGKGDAVRKGFSEGLAAILLMISRTPTLTVAPEDLPRFYEAWRSGERPTS